MRVVHALIQARMSSQRFPGKVLAPLDGIPLIRHLIQRVSVVVNPKHITILTSEETSDDPIVYYAQKMGWSVYRGPLNNVFQRFQDYLRSNEIDWFFRICADSPLIDPKILEVALSKVDNKADIVTNVEKRTFPPGQSIELLEVNTFLGIDSDVLTIDEREHVTSYYYNNKKKFTIVNFESSGFNFPLSSYAVDSTDDLGRLQAFLDS